MSSTSLDNDVPMMQKIIRSIFSVMVFHANNPVKDCRSVEMPMSSPLHSVRNATSLLYASYIPDGMPVGWSSLFSTERESLTGFSLVKYK